MKVFVQIGNDGIPTSTNTYIGLEGFSNMGFEIVYVKNYMEITNNSLSNNDGLNNKKDESITNKSITNNSIINKSITKDDIFLGGISMTKNVLRYLGIDIKDIDYPISLEKYLGRKVVKQKMGNILDNKFPFFIKPVEGKLFTGIVVNNEDELLNNIISKVIDKDSFFCQENKGKEITIKEGLQLLKDKEIFVSQVVDIVSEWRCFIINKNIVGIKNYKGKWNILPEETKIKEMIKNYTEQNISYSLDIGVTGKGETILIEVNDGYSLGTYGLEPHLYAKLVGLRWYEMVDNKNSCGYNNLYNSFLEYIKQKEKVY